MTSRLLAAVLCISVSIVVTVNAFAGKPPDKKSLPATVYPPLEIKGVRLGMSVAELTTQVPYSGCRNDYCEIYTTLAGQPANLHADFVDGKLDEVYLSKWNDGDLTDVVQGFEAKYGPPKVSTRVLQNSYGSRIECPLYTWTLADGVLWVAKYRSDTRALPQIEMKSIEHIRRDQAQHKKSEDDV